MKLTVVDDDGAMDSATASVTVEGETGAEETPTRTATATPEPTDAESPVAKILEGILDLLGLGG